MNSVIPDPYSVIKLRSTYPDSTCSNPREVNMADSDQNSESGETLCYKQRLEKSTGGEVVLMQWSPTMDLLAIALADHSVSSHKLLVMNK